MKKKTKQSLSKRLPDPPGGIPEAQTQPALPRGPWWQRDWFIGLLLVVVTTFAYQPAWNGQPIWDDEQHLNQTELWGLSGLARVWIEPGAIRQYYPLTATVSWIEHSLWGDDDNNMLGRHLVTILLHTVVALLLLRILRHLKVPGAPLAAALFALHPVQVESVAWISEIKNTLSGVFCLAAGLAYLKFDQKRQRIHYVFALGLFGLALLSKSVVATLPAALLVVVWWNRGKLSWKQDVLPAIPLFVLGAASGIVSLWMEKNVVGAKGADFQFSLVERSLIAGRAIWFYLGKIVWPEPLIFIYPRWQIGQDVWWQYLFPASALGLLVALWWLRKKWRGPLAAFLLFAGTLFPALGFVNIYPFRYSFVADHFQYLACIGPLSLAAAAITLGFSRMKVSVTQIGQPLCGVLLITILGMLTWRQSHMYADMETLWKKTIARDPGGWMAYGTLGSYLAQKGQADSAIPYLEHALKIKSDNAEEHYHLGFALKQKGLTDQAIFHFEEAVKIDPGYALASNDLGVLLTDKGELDAAISHFQTALELKPEPAGVHFNLGTALLKKGQVDAAIAHFKIVLQGKSDDAEAHRRLGLALEQKGQISEAILQYQTVVALEPDHADAYNNLGSALLANGQPSESILQFQKVLTLKRDNVDALNSLAWTLATTSQSALRNGAKAVEFAERATVLTNGGDPNVLNTLAAAYAEAGRFEEALRTARNLLRFAEARSDSALAETLRKEIALYQTRRALR